MALEISGKSKFMMYNSMCCLLQALEGKFIKVDIRNDSVIEGKLISVESTMNLNMTNVTMTNVKGIKTCFAKFYIHGRQIRYVHIPDEVDIVKAMQFQLSRKRFHQQKERDERKKLFENRQLRRAKSMRKAEAQGKSSHHSQSQRDQRPTFKQSYDK